MKKLLMLIFIVSSFSVLAQEKTLISTTTEAAEFRDYIVEQLDKSIVFFNKENPVKACKFDNKIVGAFSMIDIKDTFRDAWTFKMKLGYIEFVQDQIENKACLEPSSITDNKSFAKRREAIRDDLLSLTLE